MWQGHPSSRNIEQDINSMVQGNEFVENIATETLSRAEIDDKLNLIEQDLKAVRE